MKLTAGILLVYTQDNIFWQNKQCKRKTPYSRPVLLMFLSCQEETELTDAPKCWAKFILFQCVIQQQFFKVNSFWIWGNMCTILLYFYPCCDGAKLAQSQLAKCYLQLSLNSSLLIEVQCSECNTSSPGLNFFL